MARTCCLCRICFDIQNIEKQRPSRPALNHQTPDTWRVEKPVPNSHDKSFWRKYHTEDRRARNWRWIWQRLFDTDILIIRWWPSRRSSRRPMWTFDTDTRDRGQLFEHVINVASRWHPCKETSERAQTWPRRQCHWKIQCKSYPWHLRIQSEILGWGCYRTDRKCDCWIDVHHVRRKRWPYLIIWCHSWP